MPPNAKASFHLLDLKDFPCEDLASPSLQPPPPPSEQEETTTCVSKLLDSKSDTHGLSKDDTEGDWTDCKHSERKKRDRILDDGVLLKLMMKSDYEGFKRLFTNLGILAMTAFGIYRLGGVFPWRNDNLTLEKLALFVTLYLLYGFQIQCFAFAGQHEFLHRNAFKSKWINDWCLFVVGTVCFEFGKHERLMHKQHHTFTNNIDKDPELTSYYSRKQLEDPGFRNVPSSKFSYFRGFLDVMFTFRCRLCRLLFSACGVAVDYSGIMWSMKTDTYSQESGILQDLANSARAQLLIYVLVFATVGTAEGGLEALFFWWLVPVIIGYPAVNYFRNLEHADCELSKFPNCLKNTRTVRSNAIIRQLLWNTNFHAEHHCYPMVPFFNLPKVNALMHDHVVHNETLHFTTQNWACVKKDGWIDQQQQGKNNRKVD